MIGALIILGLPGLQVRMIQMVAIATSAASFVLAWSLLASFDQSSAALQFVERLSWVPEMGMTYAIGVDGLSFPMVLLTTLMSLVAIVASTRITERVKAYFAWIMVLETAMLGVFMAQDWFLFYMFYEITLIPMFFLIGI